jgi:DNA repair photolyase
MVLRDLDILRKAELMEVGLSITTANDEIRKIFEPHAPSIPERLKAIDIIHRYGIKTYVMIAPILPHAENLVTVLKGKVDYIIFDRMNYHHADRIYDNFGWTNKNTDDYFLRTGSMIARECRKLGIECNPAY